MNMESMWRNCLQTSALLYSFQEREAEGRFAELHEQQSSGEKAEARRLRLLEEEMALARDHVGNIEQTQEEMFGMSSVYQQIFRVDIKLFKIVIITNNINSIVIIIIKGIV